VVTPGSGPGFTVTSSSAFFVDFAITPDTRGNWTASTTDKAGNPLVSKTGAPMVAVELQGFPAQDEIWSLHLSGVAAPISLTVGFREDLASLADRFGERVKLLAGAPYVVSVWGRVITLSRTDLQPFTASMSINTQSAGAGQVTAQLRFTDSNWNIRQRIYVQALDDTFIDGGDALVFPAFEERVNSIRGPLAIEGGLRVGERS
jgi:hypothetical protein